MSYAVRLGTTAPSAMINVSTRWVQTQLRAGGIPVSVDNQAGPLTMSALLSVHEEVRRRFASNLPPPEVYPSPDERPLSATGPYASNIRMTRALQQHLAAATTGPGPGGTTPGGGGGSDVVVDEDAPPARRPAETDYTTYALGAAGVLLLVGLVWYARKGKRRKKG